MSAAATAPRAVTVILTKKRGKVHSRSSQKDSGNKAESDFIPFLNIMNEW